MVVVFGGYPRVVAQNKVRVTLDVNIVVINIARAFLSLFAFMTVLGVLWSEGTGALFEYFLWLSLAVVFFYGIFVAGKKQSQRNSRMENIIFMYGVIALILSGLYGFLGMTEIAGIIFLLIMLILFLVVFKLKPHQNSNGRSEPPPG